MAGSLFDKRKRDEVKGALARGDLERVLRKKHEAVPDDEATTLITRPASPRKQGDVSDGETTGLFPIPAAPRHRTVMQAPVPAAMNPPPIPATAPAPLRKDAYHHSQVFAVDVSNGPMDLDQALFDAIKEGNMQKAIDAITRGADVHSKYTYAPGHRAGDTVMFERLTPLQYARKKGRQDFVEMLQRYGARE